MTEASDGDEAVPNVEEQNRNFFALIGHCVTGYQGVEDYLPNVFTAALGGPKIRAQAIFNVVRGLEAKLDLITAALLSADNVHQIRWAGLLKRVAAAADARNQIAHARLSQTIVTSPLLLDLPPEERPPVVPVSVQMELRKRTRKNEVVWTSELLVREFNKTYELERYLVGFVMQLDGKDPPAYLLEDPR